MYRFFLLGHFYHFCSLYVFIRLATMVASCKGRLRPRQTSSEVSLEEPSNLLPQDSLETAAVPTEGSLSLSRSCFLSRPCSHSHAHCCLKNSTTICAIHRRETLTLLVDRIERCFGVLKCNG
ncbi:hypothetical protein LOK49_Contig56G00001, partial [Camellia lanceoleosa]